MSRNKKQSKISSVSAVKNPSFLFFFTPGKSGIENLKILDESVKRLKKEYQDTCSFCILDTAEDKPGQLLESNKNELEALCASNVRIFRKPDLINTDDEIYLKADISVWLSLEGLVRPINFNEFFRAEISSPAENECQLINWDDNTTSTTKGWILNPNTSGYLLDQKVFAQNPDLDDFFWYIRQNTISQKFQTLQHPSPYNSVRLIKDFKFNPIPDLNRWLEWNIFSAFRKPEGTILSLKSINAPLARLFFLIIALASLIILPVISFNAGISGDEEKHYNQAEKVYNYFITDGKDTSCLTDEKFKLNYYGQSFDLFTFVVIKKLNIEKIYEARHVMNGALGAFAILCSGLLARALLGNTAGIITMLLMLFSPGFMGHAMNNPLDIPFAFGYIFTLLHLVRFLKRLPVINYGIAFLIVLGIAFTISIRIGGLILIPYIFMFSGLYLLFFQLPWKNFSKQWYRLAGKGILVLTVISILSFILSLLPWPYALQSPLKNPIEAMKIMENITVALRVMFDGKIIWSDNLPASYIPKSIILSIPLMVMAGFLAALFLIRKNRNAFWIFFLFFVVVFPVVYIIYKESNVYGAWRHLLFIYPPMVVMAGLGMQSILDLSGNKYVKSAIVLLFIATIIKPASHIIRNYPNHYIYFNEFAGGVKKAYKKYETDYYMVSLKQGTEWLIQNVIENSGADSLNPILIASNAPTDIMNYYFRDYMDKVRLPYTRYYDRGVHNWDYAVYFCNYIDPYQINHNIWPPKNTIFSVTIDGVKICAVVKRENKDDYAGFVLFDQSLKTRSSIKLDESIQLMESALEYDKYNEITYLNIAQAYILKEDFETARKKLNILLSFYPNYEKALNLIGYSYLNEGEIKQDKSKIERAISLFNETIRINYKFAGAYHNLGLASLIKGDDTEAFRYFQSSIDHNPNARDSYLMMANILEKRGDAQQARNIRDYASRL
jgi:tetratricopeptide (TPR) repeat protein